MTLAAHARSETSLPDEELLLLAKSLAAACAFAGLAPQDAEDVVQDALTWIVESGNLSMVILAPWLTAVLSNFLRRHKRRRSREARVFSNATIGDIPEPPAAASAEPSPSEARLFIQRLAERSPSTDRELLHMMAMGMRLSEAARALGIAHGSEQFHIGRLKALALRLKHPRRLPTREEDR
jgi:DNA-directed RNA polymerase specialized sigma24 family protein